MTLIYENVFVNGTERIIAFPPYSSILPRKKAEEISTKPLMEYLERYRESDGAAAGILKYARGKSGGCARLLKQPDSSLYLVCPMKDWISGIGAVKYAADIQAGMTIDGEEERDSSIPWVIKSLEEGMEETLHCVCCEDGYEPISIIPVIWGPKDKPISSYKIDTDSIYEEHDFAGKEIRPLSGLYRLALFDLMPLENEWDIIENGFPSQKAAVAFTENTGGIELIPGILKLNSKYDISTETGMRDAIYSVDTESSKTQKGKELLNRITVHMNIRDGHTIAHKLNPKTKEIEVVYNGELEDALSGGLWDVREKRKVAPAREKVKKVIENFPEKLGKCEGLYQLMEE